MDVEARREVTERGSAADPELLERLELTGGGRRARWPWLVGAGGVLLLGLILVNPCSSGGPEPELVAVERGDLVVHVEAVGTLEPLDEVEIGPELSGIVAEVRVQANDRVSAGDVLAVLDTRMLEAQADQADAEVAAARATLRQSEVQEELAGLERARTESIGTERGVSQADLDRARLDHEARGAAVDLARAQLQRALAAQRVATANLDKAVLRSPTDGVVLERHVDAGQAVVTSLQTPVLFRVAAGLERMKLVVEIDEADIAHVRAGQAATFTVAAWPDEVFEATVHRVNLAPIPGIDVVTYEAELHVDNVGDQLRPGMSASTQLDVDRVQDVVLVPNAALRFDPARETPPEGPHLWVADGDRLDAVSVDVGATDGEHTAVTAEVPLDTVQVAIGEGS